MSGDPTAVDAASRTRLAAIADTLIPAAHGMPAASEVDTAGAQLDRVLAARPDLAAPLERALAATGDDVLATVQRLEREDPDAHAALLATIAGGYYIHPEVRARLRYDGQEPHPVTPEIIPNYADEGLIDPVVERGPIFRPAPSQEDRA